MSTGENYLSAGHGGGRAAFEPATEIKAKRPRMEHIKGSTMDPPGGNLCPLKKDSIHGSC